MGSPITGVASDADCFSLSDNFIEVVRNDDCICTNPTLSANVACQTGDTDNFYIDVTVTVGNGTSYTLSNTGGAANETFTTDGTTQLGPFANGTPVDLTLSDDADATCSASVTNLTGNCTDDCLLTAVATSNQGSNGGIGTYYYNSINISILSGTAPFSYTWATTGYVRHSVFYAPEPGVLTDIAVIYSDNATWTVTITDADGCETVVNYIEPGLPLNIDSYTATGDLGSGTGSIDLNLVGGSGDYDFTWAGPDGYTNNVQNISDLSTGWYTVTVSDNVTGETTIGWYWVEPARRGRGKTDDLNSVVLLAQPNPFSQQTNISFTTQYGGQTQVALYDLSGKKVVDLYNSISDAQKATNVQLNADNLVNGLYIVRLITENGENQHTKITLTK